VTTVGAGRTDAGVHALGQVMTAAELSEDRDLIQLRRALNAMCGPAIAVSRCSPAAEDFHARFSARSRTYVYAVLEGELPDPFLARTTWHHAGELAIDAMNEGAGHLLGRRDFSSFGRVEAGANAERVLFELTCRRTGRLVRIRARANAFIQQMVRSLVGTLIEIGSGKLDPDRIPGVLDARDRAAAGPVAPPHGLCLVAVEYDEGWSLPSAV
jgi:tRNA pseudouridine38-40 synthase